MRYLHTMLRVRNLDVALKFYQDALGLKEVRRRTTRGGSHLSSCVRRTISRR